MDGPCYQPDDRLVIRKGASLIGHVHLASRTAHFGDAVLPIAGLHNLAVLPEYGQRGLELELVRAAAHSMRQRGAVLSLVRTSQPNILEGQGWQPARWQGWSEASARDLLSHISPQWYPQPASRRGLRVRLWRRVETDSLLPIYNTGLGGAWGVICRDDEYWRWLLSRSLYGEILVAVDDKQVRGKQTESPAIVAYAVVNGDRILELAHLPGYESARPKLLAQICRNAIESGRRAVTLHTPANDPLHDLLVTAGGSWSNNAADNKSLLVKLLDPQRWVASLHSVLRRRAKQVDLRLPLEIGFQVGLDYWKLSLSRQGCQLLNLEPEQTPLDICCTEQAFQQILLGNADSQTWQELGELDILNREAANTLTAVFRPVLYWQSALDW